MKKLVFLLACFPVLCWAQTNTFPTTGNAGVGTTSPASTLHIYNGSSGGTPHGFSGVTSENSGNAMISILTPNTVNGYYGFADSEDDFVAGIQYYHLYDIMHFRVNNHSSDMVINKDGDVGIGTTAPQGRLHISTGTSGDAVLRLEADTDNNDEYDNPMIQLRQDGSLVGVNMGFDSNTLGHNIFGIGTLYSGTEKWNTFVINTQTDNVGIGTKIPDAKLTVKGNIHAEEVKVDLSVPGPDYVFKDDYELRTLAEVQQYIKEHGHLPNIPSAKEMEENGVELGVMNMKLLEKIEELTLYIIDLKASNEQQIKAIKKELQEIKNQRK
ncbi:hypothetical protein WIW50_02060 [Flavobacteriaceae bacterium 3-367]|uniref:hypothetical protein n=1 Tax=Eudoraea algarum TaxID=3417568 RepID=UPI00327E85B1